MFEHTEYKSPVDALICVVRELTAFEEKYNMTSSEFMKRFDAGTMGNKDDFVVWAGKYQYYYGIKQDIEKILIKAA